MINQNNKSQNTNLTECVNLLHSTTEPTVLLQKNTEILVFNVLITWCL